MILEKDSLLLHDACQGWLYFHAPQKIFTTCSVREVRPVIQALDEALAQPGVWAAGFLAYEAAPGLDSALTTHPQDEFPLAWFGLYEEPERLSNLPDAPVYASHSLPWTPDIEREEYDTAIRRIKELIERGQTYQVNYTYRLRTPFVGDPVAFFLQLAAAQKAQYAALVNTGRFSILSASPELFFRLDGERLSSRPMKGTARRGRTLAEDQGQLAWLQASAKDQAENVMIVDMTRNDIGKVARIGSVQVPELFTVEKYPTVWQMVSTVCGDTEAGLAEIFTALFPAASITGAPKRSTMEIIARLERAPRHIYTGCIGYIGPGRTAQFNVAIRTALVDHQTSQAEYGIGGGITWDSAEAAEFDESLAKAKILHTRLPRFALLESLLWTPEQGYFLLDMHIDRLAQAAQYFDYPLEVGAARRALAEAVAQFNPAADDMGREATLERPLSTRTAVPRAAGRAHQPGDEGSSHLLHPHQGGLRRTEDALDGLLRAESLVITPGSRKVRLLVGETGRITIQSEPIEPPVKPKVLEVHLATSPVDSTDPFLFHKTTHREVYEQARRVCEAATGRSWDEVLLWNEHGELTEALTSNLILVLDGVCYTPPVRCGLLTGVFRRWLLEQGLLFEKTLTLDDLRQAPRLFLINSVRGVREARIVNFPAALSYARET